MGIKLFGMIDSGRRVDLADAPEEGSAMSSCDWGAGENSFAILWSMSEFGRIVNGFSILSWTFSTFLSEKPCKS
jgi:hypothetical protein